MPHRSGLAELLGEPPFTGAQVVFGMKARAGVGRQRVARETGGSRADLVYISTVRLIGEWTALPSDGVQPGRFEK